MKFTPDAWQTGTAPAEPYAQSGDDDSADLFERDDSQPAQLEITNLGFEIRPKLWLDGDRSKGSPALILRLEASLEWLIPAAALVWAVHGLLSL
ncbi:MAG TPA: hypothetical protein VGD78_15420 [Chthoniobacterales bacterium]